MGLHEAAGFNVDTAFIDTKTSFYTPEKTLDVFESGAAAGYFNPQHYDVAVSAAYLAAARDVVAAAFRWQAGEGGMVALTFSRIYALAHRT